jgi:hypothetical protein
MGDGTRLDALRALQAVATMNLRRLGLELVKPPDGSEGPATLPEDRARPARFRADGVEVAPAKANESIWEYLAREAKKPTEEQE